MPMKHGLNAELGDTGVMIDSITGRYVFVVYADNGQATKLGEASMAAHAAVRSTFIVVNGK